MKKLLYFFLGIAITFSGTVYAITIFNSDQVGSSPQSGYILQTNGTVSTWVANSGGGGSGTVSTSTAEIAGQVPYWTTTGGTPAKLTSIATTTLTLSNFPANIPSTLGFLIGGSNTTWTWWGLATTSQPSAGNLLVSNGAAGVFGVATSTLSATSPLTGSFTQIGSGGSLGIQAASASQNGYLSVGDYSLLHTATTTFSAPLVYTGGTNAVTCTSATGSVTGCLTSTDWTTFNNKSPFEFTPLVTNFNVAGVSTTTVVNFTNGLNASSTSQFANSSTTVASFINASTTNFFLNGQKFTSLLGTGLSNAAGVLGLTSNTISGITLGSNLNSHSTNSTLSGTSYNGSATVSDWGINLGNANNWSVLQQFKVSSSTTFSAGYASFGETATSTFDRAGVLTLITPLAIGSGGTASSTGGVTNGIEFYNGSTLTNGYNFNWNGTNVGIGTTTPGSLLSIGNTTGVNFTVGTTTHNTTGGIDLRNGGCFAISGTCVSGGSAGGQNLATSTVSGTIDGSNKTFTTTASPFQMFVNGVYQTPGTDYNVSGTANPYTETFTYAPASGSVLMSVYGSGGVGGTVTSIGLSSTNSTLIFGSTPVTTSGTITADLNLNNANSWTALQTFANATSTLFTASTELNIPHGATVPTLSAGDIYQNTNSTASSSIQTSEGPLFNVHSVSTVLASSTLVYMGNFGASGTTTVPITNALHKITIKSYGCSTDKGTAWITFGTGLASTTAVQCTSSGAFISPASNNVFNGRQLIKLDAGTSASSPNTITVTADIEDSN